MEIRDGSQLDIALTGLHTLWDAIRPDEPNPFSNNSNQFDAPAVSIHAYDWSDDNDQPFNLRWKDVRINWYKYCGRGMSTNRQVGKNEIKEFVSDCLAAILDTSIKSRDWKP